MSLKRKLLTTLIITLTLTLFSCDFLIDLLIDEEDEECSEGYKPLFCDEFEPSYGTINVQVTLNDLNPFVPITLYSDDFEYNNIVLEETLNVNNKSYNMPNDYYSIKALYKAIVEGDTVTVYSVDGRRLESRSEDYCDGTCYSEGNIDLDAEFDESLFED